MTVSRPRRAAGHAAAVLIALVIAVLAFLVRFNALGGALGGFDNDEFGILTRADLILDGEQPMRDFSDGELRAVWPSLTYQLPAWAQQAFGRSLFVYACLACGALALCAGLVFLLARAVGGGWAVAVIAALVVILSAPKPYNYPKLLSLTIAIVLLRWAIARPTLVRLAALAAWTVAAVLFRHDHGIYVAVTCVIGLAACGWQPWRARLRHLGAYAGCGLLLSLPSTIWVGYYFGIPRYVGEILDSVRGEGRRLRAWPAIDLSQPFATDSLIAFIYYAFWAVPIVALALFAATRWLRPQLEPRDRALGAALIAMTLIVDYVFLRSNLAARFGDAIVPTMVLAAWAAGLLGGAAAAPARVGGRAAIGALMIAVALAFFQVNSVASELRTGGFAESIDAAGRRFADVSRTMRDLPPAAWDHKPAQGTVAMARYLAECTAPTDRVLMATYAEEVPYFARRRFAGGQGAFYSNLLKSEYDQRLTLSRLARQSVPVVISHPDYRGEFATNYPLVAEHIAAHYRDVGLVSDEGGPVLRVFVETSRQPVRIDPVLGLPCFR